MPGMRLTTASSDSLYVSAGALLAGTWAEGPEAGSKANTWPEPCTSPRWSAPLGACCWLVSNLWQPWGLAEAYDIARWRLGMWQH
jgi:hypothetical protein